MPDRVPPAFPPDHYLNRELSWLEFDARVLEEAADPSNPWLERLKFLAIFSSNLDEFFEIRVAGLQQQVYAGVEPQDYGADGMAPAEQLAAIDRRARELVAEQYRILNDEVLPGLAAGGVECVRLDDLTEAERRHVDTLFRASIAPVLTPLAMILPDFGYLRDHGRPVRAVILTHAHEDHVGSLPYLLRDVRVEEVLGTRLTLGLVKSKLDEHGLLRATELREISPGD